MAMPPKKIDDSAPKVSKPKPSVVPASGHKPIHNLGRFAHPPKKGGK